MIILKELFFFLLVSTSGASNWMACEDSHWNKRKTFVFHKIVIYNPWTWKQFEDSLKISLIPKRSEFYKCSKAFSVITWDWVQNRSLYFVSCVFSCVKQNKVLATDEITGYVPTPRSLRESYRCLRTKMRNLYTTKWINRPEMEFYLVLEYTLPSTSKMTVAVLA